MTKGVLTVIEINSEEIVKEAYLVYDDKIFDMEIDEETGLLRCTIDKKYYKEDKVWVFWK